MTHDNRTSILVFALLILAFILGYSLCTTDMQPCQEDMPCWDCATMGNRICGPTPTRQVPGEPPTPSADNPMWSIPDGAYPTPSGEAA